MKKKDSWLTYWHLTKSRQDIRMDVIYTSHNKYSHRIWWCNRHLIKTRLINFWMNPQKWKEIQIQTLFREHISNGERKVKELKRKGFRKSVRKGSSKKRKPILKKRSKGCQMLKNKNRFSMRIKTWIKILKILTHPLNLLWNKFANLTNLGEKVCQNLNEL